MSESQWEHEKTIGATEHAVVPKQSGFVVPTDLPPLTDEESAGYYDEQIPWLKISYQGSEDRPEEVPPGRYYNNLTGESWKEANVLLIAIRGTQGMWPPYVPGEKHQPLCCSDDGIEPAERGTATLPGPCRVRVASGRLVDRCPMLRWTRVPGKEDEPPKCSKIPMLLLYHMESEMPVVFSTKKKGVPAVERLKQVLDYGGRRLRNPAIPDLPANFVQKIRMRLVDQKTYWTPEFVLDKTFVDPTLSMKIANAAPMLVETFKRMRTEDNINEEAAKDGTPF